MSQSDKWQLSASDTDIKSETEATIVLDDQRLAEFSRKNCLPEHVHRFVKSPAEYVFVTCQIAMGMLHNARKGLLDL